VVSSQTMAEWSVVLWSDAAQLAAELDLPPEQRPAAGLAPAAWVHQLKQAGNLQLAVKVVGLALPRMEAIAWAAAVVADCVDQQSLPVARRLLLDGTLRWLDDPSDEHRRSLFGSAQTAEDDWPEKLLALAAFFSGGSIGPEDIDPILPAPFLTGELASGAVLLTAASAGNPAAGLAMALALGEQVAVSGRAALKQ
jgi:hypothetical protein